MAQGAYNWSKLSLSSRYHLMQQLLSRLTMLPTSTMAEKSNSSYRIYKQTTSHHATIPVCMYGDTSIRKRFIIVGLHKKLGADAYKYQFPTPTFNNNRYQIAADVAVPDSKVPPEYILQGEPTEMYHWREPNPGQIHHLGNYGEGAGDCHAPHPLQSWYGLPNTQLTSNGGSRRVMLDWRPGQKSVKSDSQCN